jgi:hypothetical protein
MKWLTRGLLLFAASYVLLFVGVAAAMTRPPEQFGQVMRYLPEPLVWGALPAQRMWLWARAGRLTEGSPAPDFTLWTHDHEAQVTLSSHRGQRPVVLVFGSYT